MFCTFAEEGLWIYWTKDVESVAVKQEEKRNKGGLWMW